MINFDITKPNVLEALNIPRGENTKIGKRMSELVIIPNVKQRMIAIGKYLQSLPNDNYRACAFLSLGMFLMMSELPTALKGLNKGLNKIPR